jgi:hypothetical protein
LPNLCTLQRGRPWTVEVLAARIRFEYFDGSIRWHEAGEHVTLPRNEARKLVREGYAQVIAKGGEAVAHGE